jgi:ligand-binding sensor domain-containing protein
VVSIIFRIWIFLLSAALLVPAACARPVWHERRWAPADGVPSSISALAQTRDGFIWVGSITGLYRFDGIRFERLPDVRGNGLSESIITLVAAPDGGLWIGHESGGISYIHDGQRQVVPAHHPDDVVHQLLRAPDGSLWGKAQAATGFSCCTMWQAVGRKFWRHREGFRRKTASLAPMARSGWSAAARSGSFPGSHHIQSTSIRATRETRFARDGQGRVWVVNHGKLFHMVPAGPAPAARADFVAAIDRGSSLTSVLFDGHGDLWRLSAADGLKRFGGHGFQSIDAGEPRLPMAPAQATGTPPSLVDREGNVWFATEGGLDEFTRSTFSVPAGLDQPVRQQWAGRMVMRDGTGHVWLRYGSKLYRVGDDGRVIAVPGEVPPYFTPCPANDEGIWRFDGRSAMEHVGRHGVGQRLELGTYTSSPATSYGCAADGGGDCGSTICIRAWPA